MIERKPFFDAVRNKPFNGSLTQEQVNGLNAILDAWDCQSAMSDARWLAYMLATAKWETAHCMQPVAEWGHGAGKPYGIPDRITGQVYYGRGLVQLTWKTNYQTMDKLLGLGGELVDKPDLALRPDLAVKIMFEGMHHGLFTGAGLGRYFNETTDDPVSARRIINSLDHANDIAAIHAAFLGALNG